MSLQEKILRIFNFGDKSEQARKVLCSTVIHAQPRVIPDEKERDSYFVNEFGYRVLKVALPAIIIGNYMYLAKQKRRVPLGQLQIHREYVLYMRFISLVILGMFFYPYNDSEQQRFNFHWKYFAHVPLERLEQLAQSKELRKEFARE